MPYDFKLKVNIKEQMSLFVFIDESGKFESLDDATRPTLAGVLIPPESLPDATRQLFNLKRDLLPPNVPVEQYELKANKVLRPSAGAKKIELTERFFGEYLTSIPDLAIIAVVGRRLQEKIVATGERLPLHHAWLMQKAFDYVSHNNIDGRISFVYDAQDPTTDGKLSHAFTSFLFKHAVGKKYLERITPNPLFVSSALTPGIQIADLVAGVIRHQAEIYDGRPKSEDAAFASRINRYMQCVRELQANLSSDNRAIYYASGETMEKLRDHAAGLDIDPHI